MCVCVYVCGWGGSFTAKVICRLATAAEHPTVSFAEMFCSEMDVRREEVTLIYYFVCACLSRAFSSLTVS